MKNILIILFLISFVCNSFSQDGGGTEKDTTTFTPKKGVIKVRKKNVVTSNEPVIVDVKEGITYIGNFNIDVKLTRRDTLTFKMTDTLGSINYLLPIKPIFQSQSINKEKKQEKIDKPLSFNNHLIAYKPYFKNKAVITSDHPFYCYFDQKEVYIIEGEHSFLNKLVKKDKYSRENILELLAKKKEKGKLKYVKKDITFFSQNTTTTNKIKRTYNNLYSFNSMKNDALNNNLKYTEDPLLSERKNDSASHTDTITLEDIKLFYGFNLLTDTFDMGQEDQYIVGTTKRDTIQYLNSVCRAIDNKMLRHFKGSGVVQQKRWFIRTNPLLDFENKLEISNSNGESFICGYTIDNDTITISNPPISIFATGKVTIKRKRGYVLKEFLFKEDKKKVKFKEVAY